MSKNPAIVMERRMSNTSDSTIGFGSLLTSQLNRRAARQGYNYTVMVMGESGLGKSTFVESLFMRELRREKVSEPATKRIQTTPTVEMQTASMDIVEDGVRLRLTIVDTPGFGDAIDNDNAWENAVQYIEDQFKSYLQQESRTKRTIIDDTRVHAMVYFINPNNQGLKALDIAAMKALHHKVNIIPVIAKADTLTIEERKRLKSQVIRDISKHGIEIYNTVDEHEDNPILRAEAEALQAAIPFAAVGAEAVYELHDREIRGRRYDWGIVDIENPEHCDYALIRDMLIRSHMQDLREVTNILHYENYRAAVLEGLGGLQGLSDQNLQNLSSHSSLANLQNTQGSQQSVAAN